MSSSTASGAAAAGCARGSRSRASRSRCSASTCSTVGPSSAARRRARSSGDGGQEDLDLGVGRDDGADVAALGDPVAAGDELALLGDQRLAHLGSRGDAARRASLTSGVRIAR